MTSGVSPRGSGGRARGTAAEGEKGAIPVTRFKEVEEGETGYPMAREDRDKELRRAEAAMEAESAEAAAGACRGAGAGGPREGALVLAGPEHPTEKEGGAGAFAALREGLWGGRGRTSLGGKRGLPSR